MEDNIIIEKFYIRDETGIKDVKEKYDNLLYTLSYRILNNYDDSLECVNDTYMKAWNTIPPYRPQYFKSFLCKLDRQISIDKYRKNNSNTCLSLEELNYEIKGKNLVDDSINENALIEEINKFIRNLNFETKTIFIRKYFLLESSEEITKITNLSVNSINVKAYRIRKKLLKYLEKEGYSYEEN